MRVGFDAKRAFHNLRGLGNYSRELIRGLSLIENDWELFLFGPGLKKKSFSTWSDELTNTTNVFGPKYNPMSSLWRTFCLGPRANKLKLDLYHGLSHELPVGIKTKQVVTVHDLLWYKIPQNFSFIDRFTYRKKLRHSLDRADKILAISESTKNDLIEIMGVQENKVQVHYQPCHHSFLSPHSPELLESYQKQLNLPEHFILSIGAIEPNKNTLYTVKVFERVKQKFPGLKLVIVGDGGLYKNELFEFIDTKNLRSDIIHFSFLNTVSLKALYQLCDAFLFPSHYEGFGLPVIEALSLRAPVIASSQDNVREAGGPGCLYVDPNELEDGVDAVSKILNNSEEVISMINSGYQYVQRFHWKETTRNLVQIYKNIVQ